MAKVECEIEDTLIEVDGKVMAGVAVTCGRCNHGVEIPGEDCARTRAKAVAELHKTCPEQVRHHYVFPDQLIEDRGSLRLENSDVE